MNEPDKVTFEVKRGWLESDRRGAVVVATFSLGPGHEEDRLVGLAERRPDGSWSWLVYAGPHLAPRSTDGSAPTQELALAEIASALTVYRNQLSHKIAEQEQVLAKAQQAYEQAPDWSGAHLPTVEMAQDQLARLQMLDKVLAWPGPEEEQ